MIDKSMTLEALREFLEEEIAVAELEIAETKKLEGNDYDQNSYGAGYDAAELATLKFILAYLKGRQ